MFSISVILTSFNHADFLSEAIESTLNQTYKDFELIIWDDASTDNSWDIISRYQDPRIRAFRNSEQMRGIHNINKAILEVAQGDFIAIHHSDDIWELDKLEKQIDFLRANPDVGAVFTNAFIINEDGGEFQDKEHFYYSIFNQENRTRHQWLRRFFDIGNALCHPSVMIRKQCYSDCGLYRYGLGQLGDFDMWIRLCLQYEIHILPEKLIRFRIQNNEANTSGNRPDSRSRTCFETYLLLFNFLGFKKVEDLLKVFPEASKYLEESGGNMKYSLARAILDMSPQHYSTQFALHVLFDCINEPDSNVRDFFKSRDYVKMTGVLDPMRVREIEQLRQTNDINTMMEFNFRNLQMENERLSIELSNIKMSFFWKILSPFRKIKKRVSLLFRR
nr:hypothetical protein HAGR004_15090 [Bdellovibrio sp. HAGR004]